MADPAHHNEPDEQVTTLLEKIERNTAFSWWSVVREGLLRGASFTLGSVCIIAIASWLLSFLGIIPGLDEIARYLNELLHSRTGG